MKKVKWLKRPEAKNWFSANVYLGLLGYGRSPIPAAGRSKLKVEWFPAKDILRAAGLNLLHEGSQKVESKVEKIKKGTKLSPVILVITKPGTLVIADGFHRISALYYVDREILVPAIVKNLK